MNEAVTLLCFPYAGGSAGFYTRWRRVLPNITVIPVDIPGRSAAHGAGAQMTRDGLIEYLLKHYLRCCVPPFALFGHSLGARVAFELQTVLQHNHGLHASRLFISGCLSPERFASAMVAHEQDLSDSTLLRVLAELGGTPPELLCNPVVMRAALPMIRANFELAIDLSKSATSPIASPIDLLLGSRDTVTSLFEDYSGWLRHTSRGCQVSLFEGDHFFIRSQTDQVASLVREKLQEVARHEG
ncbi:MULTISPECIES: thioesterase II family protein [Pseudomonas]|uniref:thioesterase II family protein n=1 Tax=Pseudomonas TaxID=286 RepID=UPI001BE99C0F|nr:MULTISPECIES: alpha/beta fold hydrolase [Pseudomonas]MBT2340711.1 thioesterase [Pseudomonas fluorescens]MCD4528851.1 alpha/beta fold hydrolase [Pseudomonas sp. C3-2018]